MRTLWSVVTIAFVLVGCAGTQKTDGFSVTEVAPETADDCAKINAQGKVGTKWKSTDHCISVKVSIVSGKAVITLTCPVKNQPNEEPCDDLELNSDPRHWIVWRLDDAAAANYQFDDTGIDFGSYSAGPQSQFYLSELPIGRKTFVWRDFNLDKIRYWYKIYLRDKSTGAPIQGDPSVWNNG